MSALAVMPWPLALGYIVTLTCRAAGKKAGGAERRAGSGEFSVLFTGAATQWAKQRLEARGAPKLATHFVQWHACSGVQRRAGGRRQAPPAPQQPPTCPNLEWMASVMVWSL